MRIQDETYEIVLPDISYDFNNCHNDERSNEIKTYSSDEALIECINARGIVDLKYMSEISSLPIEELISNLRGTAIFQDPESFDGWPKWSLEDGWLLAPCYLCGNIPEKYAIAVKAEERFPGCFEANVKALKRLMPSKLSLAEIHVSLGASWVPSWVYASFICDLLRLAVPPTVYFNKELSTWKIENSLFLRTSVSNYYTYGTNDLPAIRIIEQTMNARTVKVYDYTYHSNGTFDRVLNQPKTLEAQEKQRAIIRAFEEWIFSDEYRKAKLQEAYNDTYVGYTFSPYNGSFLRLPGLNPEIELYQHQRDAIARILLSQSNVLLAHDVGTGKTYEMVVSAHELKRMGLSEKNLIVVPNNVLKATVDAHKLLYPDDKILAVFPKDFAPKYRQKTLEAIRDNDYVCVYMAYSSFDMIAMSKDYWVKKKQQSIRDLRSAAANCIRSDEKYALEQEADQQSKKLAKFMQEAEDTPWLPFEKLGINTLFVDEAHNYKNIPLTSRTDNIVGMHNNGSKKCREMFEKCHNVERVIFATGTPLTNSLADLFVLQSYLQQNELRFREIDSFDMWINTFGERETIFEIDVDASNLRPITRFSSFHNLTELMSLFSTVCDFHQTEKDDKELPSFDGHKNICVPKSPAQAEYIKYLSERTEAIRSHQVKRNEDNLLKITTDGRKCALDIRLVDLSETEIIYSYLDVLNSKISACAKKVIEMYINYPGTCQIVFSDIGTPKSKFNVYDALKDILVRRGIPEYEIAFVHDATSESARAKLFDKMNKGLVRIVIGSTAKLGIGVNVQEKLIALHHLSVPWRPADMVQREGRIIRRGNTCEKVFIFCYITEGSFDSYSWQLLENKQRFISSFLSGTSGSRDQDDIADTVLSYAEVKALAIGNPLIKKRVETANRLERARMSSRQRQKQLIDLRAVIDSIPDKISSLKELRRKALRDIDRYTKCKETVPMEERHAFGEELLEAILDNILSEKERVFDTYQGFEIILPANMMRDNPYIYVTSKDGGKYYVEMDGDKALGCAMRIDRLLEDLPNRVKNFEDQIANAKKQREEAEQDLEQGNPYQDTIETLVRELESIDKKLSETEGKES